MKIKEITVKLKNGKEVEIGSATVGDTAELLNFLRKIYSESELMDFSADEAASISGGELRIQIKKYLKSKNQIMLVAVNEDGIAAFTVVSNVSGKQKERHRAKLWIAVAKEMRKAGLASHMMNQAIGIATDAGFEQLEVDLPVGNTDAAILYKKHGFSAAGKLSHAYKNENGEYTDLIKLIKSLQ